MKLMVLILAALFSFPAHAEPSTPLPSEVKELLNSGRPGAIQKAQLGTQMVDKKVQVLKAVYDHAVLGGASGATVTLRDEGGKTATLPDNAVIKFVLFDVLSNLSGSGAFLSVGANTTTDLKGATSASSWSGLVAGVPVGTAGTAVKTTDMREITATITGGNIVEGKFNAFIEYFVSD